VNGDPDYADYRKFVQRVITTTQRSEEVNSKLQAVAVPTLVNLSMVAGHFNDATITLCFDSLVRYVKEQTTEGHDEAREARFLDALVALVPMMGLMLTRNVSRYNQTIILSQMAGLLSKSKIGVSDMDVVRGFFLNFRLGYRESPDLSIDDYRWTGQRFDLITSHWEMFEERGTLDRGFILQLDDPDGSKALSVGVI